MAFPLPLTKVEKDSIYKYEAVEFEKARKYNLQLQSDKLASKCLSNFIGRGKSIFRK